MPGPEDYPYIHPDTPAAVPIGHGSSESHSAELNPAYFFQKDGGALPDDIPAPETDFVDGVSGEVTTHGRLEDDTMGVGAGLVDTAGRTPQERKEGETPGEGEDTPAEPTDDAPTSEPEPETKPEPEPEPAPAPAPERPSDGASTAVWRTWARNAHGLTEADVAQLTKKEIQQLYPAT